MKKMTRLKALLPLLGVISLLGFSVSFAQNWPARPITLVVTFAAGSGDDVLTRIISPHLSALLGQQFVVENVGGAGGMNGTSRVARAAPDGYEAVIGGTGTFAANQTLYKNPSYNAVTDFVPVGMVAEQPLLRVVRKDFPADNLQQFIAYAKANHDNLRFASGGTGSATHLGCVLLNSTLGIDVTHVPYRSTAIAIQDMLAGRIDYACPIASTALSQVQAKQLKAIAILTKKRSPVLPELATAQEQGLKDFEGYIWNGIFLPKGTPAAIVAKFNDALVKTLDKPEVQERVRQIGGEVVSKDIRTPDYLRSFVPTEIAKWAAPIKAAGLSID
jgi:tripartite-type tricarboxylate transporter receptor subunit TctC